MQKNVDSSGGFCWAYEKCNINHELILPFLCFLFRNMRIIPPIFLKRFYQAVCAFSQYIFSCTGCSPECWVLLSNVTPKVKVSLKISDLHFWQTFTAVRQRQGQFAVTNWFHVSTWTTVTSFWESEKPPAFHLIQSASAFFGRHEDLCFARMLYIPKYCQSSLFLGWFRWRWIFSGNLAVGKPGKTSRMI